MPSAAAIYCRISDDRTGEGLGVARQEADCLALCERKGWAVAEVYVDNDTGAWSGKPRPEYRRMLADVKAGARDAVVVWHLDRLTRRPVELEEFFDVCDGAGVKDLASVTGDVDLATHDGRFLARILGAVARKESDDKSRRTRRKHLELAERGKPVGGTRPFGYEKGGLIIRETEAALIRAAAARVLAGGSIRGICMEWNRDGVETPRSGRWTQTSIRRILTSWRIAGIRALGDEPMASDAWPAIVDPVTHQHLRDVLTTPGRSRGGYGPRSHLLTGLLYCGKCGTRLIARPQSNRRRTYVCTSNPDRGGCGGIRIVADDLERMIVEAIAYRIESPEFTDRRDAAVDVGDHGVSEVAACEAKLNELAANWARDELTRDEWLNARRAVEARLQTARRTMSAHQGSNVIDRWRGHDLLDEWTGIPLDAQHGIVAAAAERITIKPATHSRGKFDPDRVEITWRD